ncbi:glycosyltransferase family A protein [Kinneretia asaccharophila]|uniref:glycosyltransferase family 2 protein n=1 Tax=Roseateles asaccharophilus TaxID=582607 RepID=UPI001B87B886|nr:glycosyltransferase family A protein [Roseateles asaccharophilus]MDN3545614.1 glycosyltransferase family A protein [Roseateles asaccharophilus]
MIKALNEEQRIAACLDSVMAATRGLDAEVVLVDSLSNDRTVEIASQYPIRIVQFERLADRGCGAAVQLGYQVANGEFIYVLDADMQLNAGFLAIAMKALEEDKGLAGVAGRLIDQAVRTQSDARRARLAAEQQSDIEVHELGGGGLYRRLAIEQVGYLANRWLKAYEEADLGARLRAAGWRLKRLHAVAVQHQGHAETNAAMLIRLWRNGRAKAGGAFLRAAWGRPWWDLAVRKQWYVFVNLAAWIVSVVGAMAGAIVGISPSLVLACVVASPLLLVALLALKKRSPAQGAWAWVSWQVVTVAAVLGCTSAPLDPFLPIPFKEVAVPSGAVNEGWMA